MPHRLRASEGGGRGQDIVQSPIAPEDRLVFIGNCWHKMIFKVGKQWICRVDIAGSFEMGKRNSGPLGMFYQVGKVRSPSEELERRCAVYGDVQ